MINPNYLAMQDEPDENVVVRDVPKETPCFQAGAVLICNSNIFEQCVVNVVTNKMAATFDQLSRSVVSGSQRRQRPLMKRHSRAPKTTRLFDAENHCQVQNFAVQNNRPLLQIMITRSVVCWISV